MGVKERAVPGVFDRDHRYLNLAAALCPMPQTLWRWLNFSGTGQQRLAN